MVSKANATPESFTVNGARFYCDTKISVIVRLFLTVRSFFTRLINSLRKRAWNTQQLSSYRYSTCSSSFVRGSTTNEWKQPHLYQASIEIQDNRHSLFVLFKPPVLSFILSPSRLSSDGAKCPTIEFECTTFPRNKFTEIIPIENTVSSMNYRYRNLQLAEKTR